MLDIFLTVILPVFIVAACGAALQRWRNLSIGALSPITVYLLSPMLVFRFILNAELPAATSGRVVAAGLATTAAVLIAAALASLVARHARPMRSAFLLATVFPNVGNMGLPVSLLAFGEPGLEVAVIAFVTQAAIAWPLGIFIAARSRLHPTDAIVQALKIPTIYALALALVIRALGWDIPFTIEAPVGLLADAAIPAMLIVLGFQLSQGVELARWRSLVGASVIRLLVAAALAYAATIVIGIEGVAQMTVITMAAMPAAVFPTLLATEFEAEPRFVSSGVIVSTLASLVTLTLVISAGERWL